MNLRTFLSWACTEGISGNNQASSSFGVVAEFFASHTSSSSFTFHMAKMYYKLKNPKRSFSSIHSYTQQMNIDTYHKLKELLSNKEIADFNIRYNTTFSDKEQRKLLRARIGDLVATREQANL